MKNYLRLSRLLLGTQTASNSWDTIGKEIKLKKRTIKWRQIKNTWIMLKYNLRQNLRVASKTLNSKLLKNVRRLSRYNQIFRYRRISYSRKSN